MLSKNQPFRNSFILPSTHPTTNQYQHNTRDKPSLRDINARQRVYAPSTHTLTAIQSYIHSTSDKPILLDINPLKNLSTPQTQTYMYFVGTALPILISENFSAPTKTTSKTSLFTGAIPNPVRNSQTSRFVSFRSQVKARECQAGEIACCYGCSR